jgi:hypothetical protein
MATIRTSTDTSGQTTSKKASVSTSTLFLAASNPQAIGRTDDLRALREPAEEQPVAIVESQPRPPLQELRKATRYQFNSAAVMRWLGSDDETHQSFAIVRNISVNGVYVESTAPLSMDINVELEIMLPNPRSKSSRPELNFEGKIVRVVDQNGRREFAVAGWFYISSEAELEAP